jgi:leucyl aminopeptidase
LTNYNCKLTGNVSNSNDKDNNADNKKVSPIIEEIEIADSYINDVTLNSYNKWINYSNAVLYTRNLANTRANIADCDFMEDIALNIVNKNKKNCSVKVIKGEDLVKNNLNLLYNVGKSASTEPRLIILKYNGNPNSNIITHGIVGKGLTFDTGGLNLKPTNFIETMYDDKHGACNALAVFKSVAEMNWPINLICAIAVAENSIDGTSYKPSDIITSHKVKFY